jgi:putative membrane protein
MGLSIIVVLLFMIMGSLGTVIQEAMRSNNAMAPLIIIIGGIGLIALIIALIALGSYLSYKRFLWEITQTDIHIYSGIIIKKQAHIPFYRVQSIDFNAGIIDRILGIVKLKVETAGGAANQSSVIPALKLNEAEALRAEVFSRKRALSQQAQANKPGRSPGAPASAVPRFDPQTGQPLPAPAVPRFDPQTGAPLSPAHSAAAAAATATGTAGALVQDFANSASSMRGIFAEDYNEDAPIEYEYGLSGKELFLASISGDHNVVAFAAIIGFISQIPTFLGLFSIDNKAFELVIRNLIERSVGILIGGLILLFVVVFVLTLAGTMLSYGGFKARRRGGRVEVERGLLQRRYKGVSLSRVQSLEIKQGFIRKRMGYAEVKLLTVDTLDASGGQQNGQQMQLGLVIHPFIKLERVPEIVQHMVPDYALVPAQAELKKLPKVAFRRSLFRNIVWSGVPCALFLVGLLGFFVPLVVPTEHQTLATVFAVIPVAIIMVWRIFAGILWYRHAAYGYNQGMLTIQQGSFGQTTTHMPRKKIQWAANRETPLQRWRKLATIGATTAAGVSGTRTALRDVALADADAFIEWVRPRVAATAATASATASAAATAAASAATAAAPTPAAAPAPTPSPDRTEVSH